MPRAAAAKATAYAAQKSEPFAAVADTRQSPHLIFARSGSTSTPLWPRAPTTTRRAYRSAWTAWQRWARRAQAPAAPGVRRRCRRLPAGAAPASIRVACAAIARVHQVSGFPSPVADCRCCDLLRRICREGRSRGRGQVAGVGWKQAEEAAARAEDSGSQHGLRDGAIVRLMSDSLARVNEVSALQYCDVEPETTASRTSG